MLLWVFCLMVLIVLCLLIGGGLFVCDLRLLIFVFVGLMMVC